MYWNWGNYPVSSENIYAPRIRYVPTCSLEMTQKYNFKKMHMMHAAYGLTTKTWWYQQIAWPSSKKIQPQKYKPSGDQPQKI